MQPNVFLGYLMKGIASLLSIFGHEQYPSNSVDLWCLIIEYLNEGIGFFVGFGRATLYLFTFQTICYEPNVFLGYYEGVLHVH
jgi:hypothetical protein